MSMSCRKVSNDSFICTETIRLFAIDWSRDNIDLGIHFLISFRWLRSIGASSVNPSHGSFSILDSVKKVRGDNNSFLLLILQRDDQWFLINAKCIRWVCLLTNRFHFTIFQLKVTDDVKMWQDKKNQTGPPGEFFRVTYVPTAFWLLAWSTIEQRHEKIRYTSELYNIMNRKVTWKKLQIAS